MTQYHEIITQLSAAVKCVHTIKRLESERVRIEAKLSQLVTIDNSNDYETKSALYRRFDVIKAEIETVTRQLIDALYNYKMLMIDDPLPMTTKFKLMDDGFFIYAGFDVVTSDMLSLPAPAPENDPTSVLDENEGRYYRFVATIESES